MAPEGTEAAGEKRAEAMSTLGALGVIAVTEGTGLTACMAVHVAVRVISRGRARSDVAASARLMIYVNGGSVIGALTAGAWPRAVVYAVICCGIAAWLWWRRKKRRTAAQLLGAKSRQLRDALVKRAREAGTPRPVLRPVPVR